MTPAELLAASKPRRRAKRNGPPAGPRTAVWAAAIRHRREALNLSMRDVAAAVGLSLPCYWSVEHGTDPMLTTARRIAAFFGATVEELWPALLPVPNPVHPATPSSPGP